MNEVELEKQKVPKSGGSRFLRGSCCTWIEHKRI